MEGFELRFEKGLVVNHLRVTEAVSLPHIKPSSEGTVGTNKGGGLAYDPSSRGLYYFDNQLPNRWKPVGSGGPVPGGTSLGYSLDKSAQPINSEVATILTGWSLTSPSYDRTLSWNALTGVFTATSALDLQVTANITWEPGESNSGTRTLQIIHKRPALPVRIAATVTRQAEPDILNETTQTASVGIAVSVGDQVWTRVSHTSAGVIHIADTSRLSGVATAP